MRYGISVSIAAILLAVSGGALAQEGGATARDVVLLKNGGKLRGVITEQMPGDYVVVQLPGGETRRFSDQEVSYAGPEDSAPKAAPKSQPAAPAAAPQPSGGTVSVKTTEDGVTVAEITDRMIAQAGNTVAVGAAWRDICTAPCTFKLDPGLHEVMIYGDGFPAVSKKIDIREGQEHKELVAKPGSSGLAYLGSTLVVLGGVAAILGGTFLVVATETTEYNADGSETTTESGTHKLGLPLLLGGIGGVAGGIGLVIAGSSSLEEAQADRHAQKPDARPTAYGISYSGVF